ncbi:MAG TPA: hypothetical protein VKV39_20160 [Candidatus Sulfotelmatobacter sp.]|nr:hypothetical protein [Candidatus Sulfotelmatobacter sp.]
MKRATPYWIYSSVAVWGLLCGMLSAQTDATANSKQTASSEQAVEKSVTPLPDSPGAVRSQSSALPSDGSGNRNDGSPILLSQAGNQSTSQKSQPEANSQKPVGTAAAEAPNAGGIAASQPAGIAMAPAKQHRVRTIVLRTGAIIGAGVAIGAVVALTAATPSKPPGAR